MSTRILVIEQAHAVQADDEHCTHVGDNGEPELRVTKSSEDYHSSLGDEGEDYVLPDRFETF